MKKRGVITEYLPWLLISLAVLAILMVVILFLGGIQLIFIGFIGEYLGRTYSESKHRPLYFLNEYHQSKSLKGENK